MQFDKAPTTDDVLGTLPEDMDPEELKQIEDELMIADACEERLAPGFATQLKTWLDAQAPEQGGLIC